MSRWIPNTVDDQHPRYGLPLWLEAAHNGKTRNSYWDWVNQKLGEEARLLLPLDLREELVAILDHFESNFILSDSLADRTTSCCLALSRLGLEEGNEH